MRICMYSFVTFFLKLPFQQPFRENLLPLPGSFRDSVFCNFMCFEHFYLRELMGKPGETCRKQDKYQNLPGKPTSHSGKLPGLRVFAMSELSRIHLENNKSKSLLRFW